MSISRKLPLNLFLAAMLAGLMSTPALARPNMWWDTFPSAMPNQTECVKQAETIMTAEKAGQLSSDADSVRGWSEKSVTVAECLKFGDQLIVMVLVSSDDPVAGNTLFNALRTGMMKQ